MTVDKPTIRAWHVNLVHAVENGILNDSYSALASVRGPSLADYVPVRQPCGQAGLSERCACGPPRGEYWAPIICPGNQSIGPDIRL